jgi:hypothetical protein
LPIAAGARERPVEDIAYAHITGTICEAVARGGDGIMLDLRRHGHQRMAGSSSNACARSTRADRGVARHHANLYDNVASATVITGYRTLPAYRHLRDR